MARSTKPDRILPLPHDSDSFPPLHHCLHQTRGATLIDEYDGTVGTDHTGHEFVTVLGEGATFDSAARSLVTDLQTRGLRILRLVPDLVTRSEIAARLGVTRQAVQAWTSGKRQSGFPQAINPVAGGTWSWHDVWHWAVEHHYAVDDGAHYPSQAETDIINVWITAVHAPSRELAPSA